MGDPTPDRTSGYVICPFRHDGGSGDPDAPVMGLLCAFPDALYDRLRAGKVDEVVLLAFGTWDDDICRMSDFSQIVPAFDAVCLFLCAFIDSAFRVFSALCHLYCALLVHEVRLCSGILDILTRPYRPGTRQGREAAF